MKKLGLTFLLLFISFQLYSQISGNYVTDIKGELKCYLKIFDDGQYYLNTTENLSSGFICVRIISIGLYSVENNIVSLRDKFHAFNMRLRILNDSLKMEESFGFLKNKFFSLHSEFSDDYPLKWLDNSDSTSLYQERQEYKKHNHKLYKLYYANYITEDRSWCSENYNLTINQDNSYRLYLKELLISEGKWVREGVDLVLHDKSLQKSLYMMIGKSKIIGRILPDELTPEVLVYNHK